MRQAVPLLALMAILLTLVAVNRGSQVRAQGAAADAPSQSLGREVFDRSCAICHGQQGEGRIGPPLDRNLDLDRADYVTAIILRGRDGMPPFHDRLTESEVAAVADYVRNAWGNDFAARQQATDDGPAPEGDNSDAAQKELVAQWWQGADDGAELFARVCARCHGEDGGGGFGPALVGNDNLGNAQYVVGKILHGQGGMPAFEGLVTTDQVALLAGYVRRSFAGELGSVSTQLVRSLQSTRDLPGSLGITVFPGDSRLSVAGPDGYLRVVSGRAANNGRLTLENLVPGTYTVTATADDFGPAVAEAEVLPLHLTALTVNLEASLEGAATASSQVASASELTPEVLPGGIDYRRSCAMCHGPEGGGGVGPPLAGNSGLQYAQFVLDRILAGTRVMPSFADRLGPRQIAAIATFERNSWGNSFGPVSVEQVEARQGNESGPEVPWPAGLASGSEMYEEYCAVCHGGLGYGGVGPALQGNTALADLPYTVSRIVMGGGGMPSFHGLLSNAEIAEVASFIREAWGNEFGLVEISRVQNYHGGSSSLGE